VENESHVEDLELILQQVKAVHVVAQRDNKKALRYSLSLSFLDPTPNLSCA